MNPFSYGFNNNYTDVFKGLSEEVIELFSADPEKTVVEERLAVAREEVASDFQLEHYLYDMNENEDIEPILNFLPTK